MFKFLTQLGVNNLCFHTFNEVKFWKVMILHNIMIFSYSLTLRSHFTFVVWFDDNALVNLIYDLIISKIFYNDYYLYIFNMPWSYKYIYTYIGSYFRLLNDVL